jgi:S1-C subfamily serine protease
VTFEGGPQELLTSLSDALAAAVERVTPSIVRVDVRQRRSQGTGVVWAEDGLIVTADHVLERGEDVEVVLPDGKILAADIVGRDPDRDIGLLRIGAKSLTPIAHGASPRVGHLVLAIGRVNERLMATIGLVNAVRPAGKRTNTGASLVQTDALLYPGFSGGPLLDAAGRMVGMNTQKNRSGAGMAVALDAVCETADAMLSGGRVKRGYIGVVTQVVALPASFRDPLGLAQSGGLLISSIEPGSPAEEAGLFLGDVLIGLDGHLLQDAKDLRMVLTPDRVGDKLAASIIRGGQLKEVALPIGERDE